MSSGGASTRPPSSSRTERASCRMTPSEVLSMLAGGAYGTLKGVPEDRHLEFKGAPYQLSDERNKWELAKDTAAFANDEGGIIVIGFATERHPNELEDTVTRVQLVKKSLVIPDQVRSVIDSWVYPRIRNVTLAWYPDDATVADGVLVITVPEQAVSDKPFLLRRVFTEPLGKKAAQPRDLPGAVAWPV